MSTKELKVYRLYHRSLNRFADQPAEAAEEACRLQGWELADVWAREWTPCVKDPTTESGHSGGGWRNITPRTPRLETRHV